ncbi:MAG: hypothetical protein U5L96_06495 [Owenweeksia sp.]|nr:hypothetical protein [Owenweeksia sp.]
MRWLLGFIAVLIGFAFLFPPKPYPVNLAEISYGYSSSSKLYFHNMRSYFYHINENERSPLGIVSIKEKASR